MSSKKSIEQGRSGRAGAESPQPGRPGGQPRQGSGRVDKPHGNSEPKHHFDPGQAPSDQGEQDHPSPEVIARRQQGLAGSGRGSGSHAGSERSEEAAQAGAPAGEHTRRGRQQTPGDRPRR